MAAIVWLVVIYSDGHIQKQKWAPLVLVLIPLAFIWYSDAIGKNMRVCNTRTSISGYTVAFLGWVILLVPVCLAIPKHFHFLD